MAPRQSIYLDNAATTWPKPPTVLAEISRYYQELGVAAHRGASSKASEVDRTIEQCRHQIAQLINAAPDSTAFCFNGTDGLNLAINGLVESNAKVITTVVEHNSILRPLQEKRKHDNIELVAVGCSNGIVNLNEIDSAMTTDTDVCCVSHVSNVTGQIQPIEQMAQLCRDRDVLLIVDACQSVGHIPVDFNRLGADVLVASGHKGLLGPLGTGFLCLSEAARHRIRPTRTGGTGTNSESVEHPDVFPARLEAGNLNVGGIFGLLAGINFVNEFTIPAIGEHELRLINRLRHRFIENQRFECYGNDGESNGVLSFNIKGQDPQTIAAMLDSAFGIQVRAGLHCSPLIHQHLGTYIQGGTVRVSPGVFNDEEDIIRLGDALEQIMG